MESFNWTVQRNGHEEDRRVMSLIVHTKERPTFTPADIKVLIVPERQGFGAEDQTTEERLEMCLLGRLNVDEIGDPRSPGDTSRVVPIVRAGFLGGSVVAILSDESAENFAMGRPFSFAGNGVAFVHVGIAASTGNFWVWTSSGWESAVSMLGGMTLRDAHHCNRLVCGDSGSTDLGHVRCRCEDGSEATA